MKLRQVYDELPSDNQRKKFTREHGLKGTYPFLKQPYQELIKHFQPDGMHPISDVIVTLIHFLIGKKKNKALGAGELEMLSIPLQSSVDKIQTMTVEDMNIGNRRCQLLNFPDGCLGFKGNVFTKP